MVVHTGMYKADPAILVVLSVRKLDGFPMISKLAETFYQFRLLPISKTGRNFSANSRTLHIIPTLYGSLGSGVKYRLVLECDTSGRTRYPCVCTVYRNIYSSSLPTQEARYQLQPHAFQCVPSDCMAIGETRYEPSQLSSFQRYQHQGT